MICDFDSFRPLSFSSFSCGLYTFIIIAAVMFSSFFFFNKNNIGIDLFFVFFVFQLLILI